jgi:hypothetical protein
MLVIFHLSSLKQVYQFKTIVRFVTYDTTPQHTLRILTTPAGVQQFKSIHSLTERGHDSGQNLTCKCRNRRHEEIFTPVRGDELWDGIRVHSVTRIETSDYTLRAACLPYDWF